MSYVPNPLETRVLKSIDRERGSCWASIVETLGERTDDGPSVHLVLQHLVKRGLLSASVTTLPLGTGGSRTRYYLTERGAVAIGGLAP